MTNPTVSAVDGGVSLFDTPVTDIQSDVEFANGKVSGTLKYLDTGAIADYWGAGNFLAFQLANIDANATSVKVGLTPSAGSGLVEIIDDPDLNGVAKITDKLHQKFTVITSDGTNSVTEYFDLSDLVMEGE